MSSTYTISQAQAQLPRLVKQDAFAISRHGRLVGVYLSRDRIEALVETLELLGEPAFQGALKEFESGKMRFRDVEDLEKELEHGNTRPRRKPR
ncbi:MAG: type II toxin-antitoxin system Phd/YefM family antitoxin [Limisphaerales bacterium]